MFQLLVPGLLYLTDRKTMYPLKPISRSTEKLLNNQEANHGTENQKQQRQAAGGYSERCRDIETVMNLLRN